MHLFAESTNGRVCNQLQMVGFMQYKCSKLIYTEKWLLKLSYFHLHAICQVSDYHSYSRLIITILIALLYYPLCYHEYYFCVSASQSKSFVLSGILRLYFFIAAQISHVGRPHVNSIGWVT